MIKRFYFPLTSLLIFTAHLCSAMDVELSTTKPKMIATITGITPQSISCFPNNTVAILNQNNCQLWDFVNNTKITTLKSWDYSRYQNISLIAKKKESILGLYQNGAQTLEIYDIKGKIKIWEKCSDYWRNLPIFIPTESAILIQQKNSGINSMKLYNYKDDSQITYPLPPSSNAIIYHPTKEEYATYSELLEFSNYINILQLLPDQKSFTERNLPLDLPINTCIYNFDGSFIAIDHAYRGCGLLDIKTLTHTFLTKEEDDKAIWHMAF